MFWSFGVKFAPQIHKKMPGVSTICIREIKVHVDEICLQMQR